MLCSPVKKLGKLAVKTCKLVWVKEFMFGGRGGF